MPGFGRRKARSALPLPPSENAETAQNALFGPIPASDAVNLPVAATYYYKYGFPIMRRYELVLRVGQK